MADDGTRFALGRFTLDEPDDAAPVWCVVVDDAVYPLAGVLSAGGAGDIPARAPGLFERWDDLIDVVGRFAAQIRRDGSTVAGGLALSGVRAAAPVEPRQVFQSGANYRSHVVQLRVAHARRQDPDADALSREAADALSREAAESMDRRVAADAPYVFIGLPGAICGPYDDVVLPDTGDLHDWELELAVVIARRAYRIGVSEAMDHVAGYTICNDITTRDRVFRPDLPAIGTDWLAGKNAPTFLPTGPYLVPAPFVARPDDLRIVLTLNGDTMQDETTSDMVFGIDRLIAHVAAITPLLPGDLLLTGSPAGNGIHHGRLLRPGDVMRAGITGLGEQRSRCVRGPAT